MTDIERAERADGLLSIASTICGATVVLAMLLALGPVAVKGVANVAYEVRAIR